MTHNATVIHNLGRPRKFGWDCGQCGAWSRGYRSLTEEAAERSAQRHNRVAAERDSAVHASLYGPKGARHGQE